MLLELIDKPFLPQVAPGFNISKPERDFKIRRYGEIIHGSEPKGQDVHHM
jgi:hypothetical protein